MSIPDVNVPDVKSDIESTVGTSIHFVNAIRIRLCLGEERVNDKAQVNIQRLCMFGDEDKELNFRMSMGSDTVPKTWYTSSCWTSEEIDRVRHQNDAISLIVADDPAEDIYYLIFSDIEAFSSVVGNTNVIDYIDKTIKYDLIGSLDTDSSVCMVGEARRKTVSEFPKKGSETPYQREHIRRKGYGVKMPNKFQDMCHHGDKTHDRIRSLLIDMYLPRFRKMLRSPRPGFKYGGASITENLEREDRLAMIDDVEFDKRFLDESSDIYISFARVC